MGDVCSWVDAPAVFRRAVEIHVLADAKRRRTRCREDLVTCYDAAEMALMEARAPREAGLILEIGDFVRRYGA